MLQRCFNSLAKIFLLIIFSLLVLHLSLSFAEYGLTLLNEFEIILLDWKASLWGGSNSGYLVSLSRCCASLLSVCSLLLHWVLNLWLWTDRFNMIWLLPRSGARSVDRLHPWLELSWIQHLHLWVTGYVLGGLHELVLMGCWVTVSLEL